MSCFVIRVTGFYLVKAVSVYNVNCVLENLNKSHSNVTKNSLVFWNVLVPYTIRPPQLLIMILIIIIIKNSRCKNKQDALWAHFFVNMIVVKVRKQ